MHLTSELWNVGAAPANNQPANSPADTNESNHTISEATENTVGTPEAESASYYCDSQIQA